MKFHEITKRLYKIILLKYNFNEKNKTLIKTIQNEFSELSNIIMYGPPGSGKYTQCLNFIKNYSETI